MFQDTSTNKMLSNIRRCLENSLENKYKIKSENVVDEMIKIHGLAIENFDFIKNVEKVINEKLNDVSIDTNANKSEKTIAAINSETTTVVRKSVGLDYLYRMMESLYKKEEANRLMGEMLDLSLGLADSSNILLPYCYSVDASKIVTIGRDFGQLYSKPCKRVSSYISALCETVHQLSSHLAGAIAIGSFFLDVAHLCLYKEEIAIRDLQTDKKIRKYLENEFQQFVHSVNHLSRNSNESPFTNISVFDRTKIKTIATDMNWYFPFDDLPIDMPKFKGDEKEQEEEKKEFCLNYIADYVMEIQSIFLDFFDKGDPSKDGMPLRFPIVTINISKKKWGDAWAIQDEKFLKDICKRDIYRYNIFTSEGSKIASCCRLINDVELLDYASQSNSFGGSAISLGSHRVCTINFMRIALEAKDKEHFYKILDERIESTLKILKAHKELIIMLEKKGLQPFITNGWLNMKRMFSTVGIMGICECSKLLKEKFSSSGDVQGRILTYLNNKVKELATKYELVSNIEQIPGESFAVRLAKADKLLFKNINYEIYSNQFVPLWENKTLWERMDEDGKYNNLLTGGGIVHAQIGERVTSKQAEKIIRYAINANCEHFALNAVYSQCEDGHMSFGKIETCPTCGKKIVEQYTRVVGFFTNVSAWDKTRREWEFPKRTFVTIEKD